MVMIRIWPTGSTRRGRAARDSGTTSAVSTTAAIPTGMFTQKMPRHPTVATSTPPSTGPSAMLRPNTAPQTPSALARSRSSVNVFAMIDKATGFSIDPPMAWTARNATSQPRPGARLHSSEPTVKVARPTWNVRRRPTRSPVEPASIRKLATTSVYASTVHCRPDTGACRSCWIDGSAMFRMVTSRPTMNRLEQQTASTSRRRLRLSSGTRSSLFGTGTGTCEHTTNCCGAAAPVSNLTCVIDCAHGNRPATMTQPEQAAATTDRTAWGRHLQTPLRQFLRTETGSAAVLLAATIGALVWTNLDASSYDTLWQTEISLRLGGFGMSQDLHGWVNSGLMTFFFLVIGLEARREFDMGELRERRRFAIPLVAGLGGMVVPVAIFLAINAGRPSAGGWGTAMSTDTAFALGMLALVGPKSADRLRSYLLTFAVVDDLAAIVVIALVYSHHLDVRALVTGLAALAAVFLARAGGLRHGVLYTGLGVVAWMAFFKSGVDPAVT